MVGAVAEFGRGEVSDINIRVTIIQCKGFEGVRVMTRGYNSDGCAVIVSRLVGIGGCTGLPSTRVTGILLMTEKRGEKPTS